MRILAAADIHGSLEVYRWLIEQTPLADVLVLAGDLFDADFADEQRKQAKEIVAILQQARVPVLYIMGNDDEIALDYEDTLVQPIHGRRTEIGGYSFVGYQYTPPFVGEVFVKEDAEIAKDLVSLESLVDRQTVLVTHTPAYGSLDLCDSGSVGSEALAGFLRRKPVLAHIHGHIHYRFGVDRDHFNVASVATCRAMRIELPSLEHTILKDAS